MGTAAFAASITISRDQTYEEGTTGARTYTAYKVFDASYDLTDPLEGTNTQADTETITYDPNGPVAYTMATDSPWLSAMQAAGQTWFDVNLAADGSKYVVTLKSGVTNNAETAQAIAAYLQSNLPSGLTGTPVTPGTAATVDPGYYIITASDGATNLTLVTTDVTIVEKNTYLQTTKTTSETSYNVGDTVTYTATVTIPADTKLTANGGDPVVLHDKMDSVLKFGGSATATINADADEDGENDAFTAFTLSSTSLTDECTFEISIPVTADVLGKTITFTYTAEVTSDAATDTGLVNELFGEVNDYTTKPDTVKVYTFDFDFTKEFTGSDDDLTATFEVRTTANDASTAISFVAKADKTETTTETDPETGDEISSSTTVKVYEKADTEDTTGTVTTITITNGQKIDFVGLAAGTYYLVETGTSTGYNLLSEAVTVTITDTTDKTGSDWTPSHSVAYSGAGISGTGTIPVVNNSGTVLPSTGGIGTTIFYVVGSILVVAAGVLLITKKRMSREG